MPDAEASPNQRAPARRGSSGLLFLAESQTLRIVPKVEQKGRRKGRAKRAPLLMRSFLRLLVEFQEFATHEKKKMKKPPRFILCIFGKVMRE